MGLSGQPHLNFNIFHPASTRSWGDAQKCLYMLWLKWVSFSKANQSQSSKSLIGTDGNVTIL